MDQETANLLFHEGGIFVFLDVPPGTEFAIDMKSWNTGSNFRGVKMIPPGVHFISFNLMGAPRSGFFHNFKQREMLVKKWDSENEDIADVEDEEISGIGENKISLDKFLGPYPYDVWNKWKVLTKHITDELIEKVTPQTGIIRAVLDLLPCKDCDRNKEASTSKENKRRRLKDDDILLPDLKPIEGTDLRLTLIPEKCYPDGSSASEITKHSLDSSYILESMIQTYTTPLDILGELEFCYICFLVGHSLDAFEHWKKLVSLICSCDTAIKKHRRIYDEFITVLEEQVGEIPEEFLVDIVSNNNFVYLKLRDLFRSVMESDLDGNFKSKVERFKKKLSSVFGWDFSGLEDDDEDDAPVVVE